MEVIGSDESGKIEIVRKGYLTVSEKAFVQGTTAQDDSVSFLQALARKIAREQKKDIQEVIEALTSGDQKADFLVGYEGEIMEAIKLLGATQESQGILIATCLLIHRVDPEWGVDDRLELHPDLVEGLVALYKEEEAKSVEALVAAAEQKNAASDSESQGKE